MKVSRFNCGRGVGGLWRQGFVHEALELPAAETAIGAFPGVDDLSEMVAGGLGNELPKLRANGSFLLFSLKATHAIAQALRQRSFFSLKAMHAIARRPYCSFLSFFSLKAMHVIAQGVARPRAPPLKAVGYPGVPTHPHLNTLKGLRKNRNRHA